MTTTTEAELEKIMKRRLNRLYTNVNLNKNSFSISRILILAILFSILPAQAGTRISTGLMAHYSFNEGSGISARDASGNGNHATLMNGAMWVTGKFGQAIQFSNPTDYLSIADSGETLNPQYISVSVWVKPATIGGGLPQYIVSKDRDCCDFSGHGGYGFRINPDGVLGGEIWLASSQSLLSASGASRLTPGVWSHVAMVFNGTNIILYVNGVRDGVSPTIKQDTVQLSNKPLTVGVLSFEAPTWYPFRGQMDEIRLYSRVLSAQEIADLNGAVGGDPRLFFYESFDSDQQDNGVAISSIPREIGKFGQAGRIDGATVLKYPTLSHIDPTKGAISFWFKPLWNGTDPHQHFLVDFGNFTILTYWEQATGSYFVMRYKASDGSWNEVSTYTDEPNVLQRWQAGEWHKIEAMWDMRIQDKKNSTTDPYLGPYLLLKLDDRSVYTGYPAFGFGPLSDFFNVGSMSGYGVHQANGLFDELKIYKESLIDMSDPESYVELTKGDGIWQTHETIHNSPADASMQANQGRLADTESPGEDLIFFQTKPFEPVYEGTVPSASLITNTMRYKAAPNEYEPLFFNLYSRKDLSNIKITVSDFRSASGAISSQNLDLRVVKNWFQAGSGPTKSVIPVYVPELLLPDDTVPLAGKECDSIPGQCNWSYNNLPHLPTLGYVRTMMRSYTSKQFVIRARIPESAPSGTYTATVVVSADGLPEKTLRAKLEVYPFFLKESNKDYLIYLRGETINPTFPDYVDAVQYEKQVQDIKAHGFNGATIYGGVKEHIGTLQRNGIFGKVIAMDWSPEAKSVLTGHGYEPWFYGVDEPDNNRENNPLKIDLHIAKSQTIHAGGGKVVTAIQKKWSDYLDTKGESLDLANLTFGPDEVAYFSGLINKTLARSGPSRQRQTYYWQIHQEDPRSNRFLAGNYLWNTGLDGIFPYVYQHVQNNPYNDFDTWSENYRDHLVTYPSQEGPVPTVQWEALREGIDDMRYLTTWNSIKERVKKLNASRAQASEQKIQGILDRYKDYRNMRVIPIGQFDDDRRILAAEIVALKAYLN